MWLIVFAEQKKKYYPDIERIILPEHRENVFFY